MVKINKLVFGGASHNFSKTMKGKCG